MTLQLGISNQTATPLFLMNATKYVDLPSYSTNMSVLIPTWAEMRVGKTKVYADGMSLPKQDGVEVYHLYISSTTTGANDYFICDAEGSTATIVKFNPIHKFYTWRIDGTTVGEVGSTCKSNAAGAWNFTSTAVVGYTDAPLITPASGGSGNPPVAATTDDGWSTTTWILIGLGVVLLIAAIILIIYLATRKKPAPAALTPM